jgi:hypothetical protein
MDEPLEGSRLVQPLDSCNLSFKKYIDHNILEDFPAAADFSKKKRTPWRRMDNWIANGCTCATAGHMIECWTEVLKRPQIFRFEALTITLIYVTLTADIVNRFTLVPLLWSIANQIPLVF